MEDTITANDVSESLYLRYSIILFLGSERVKGLNTSKQGRLHHVYKSYEWDRAYLKVRYGDTDIVNEGEYTNVADLRAAITAFTEPEIKEYLTGVRQ